LTFRLTTFCGNPPCGYHGMYNLGSREKERAVWCCMKSVPIAIEYAFPTGLCSFQAIRGTNVFPKRRDGRKEKGYHELDPNFAPNSKWKPGEPLASSLHQLSIHFRPTGSASWYQVTHIMAVLGERKQTRYPNLCIRDSPRPSREHFP